MNKISKTNTEMGLPEIFSEISNLIVNSKRRVETSLNSEMVILYWNIGKYIRNNVYKENDSEYGKKTILKLSKELTINFGRGYSRSNLFNMVSFYDKFCDEEIIQTMSGQLSWSHIIEILKINDPLKIEFYITLTTNERWNTPCVNMKISMKNQIIILIAVVCVLSSYYIFNTDRFIYKNIKAIDQTEMITIIGENSRNSYEFNDKMIDLVSYGGFVIETDNLIEGLLNPYYSELDEIDLSIVYKKGNSVLGISKVYYSNEEPNKYIMYMNNVYWSTNSNVDDLLDLIQ